MISNFKLTIEKQGEEVKYKYIWAVNMMLACKKAHEEYDVKQEDIKIIEEIERQDAIPFEYQITLDYGITIWGNRIERAGHNKNSLNVWMHDRIVSTIDLRVQKVKFNFRSEECMYLTVRSVENV